MNNEKFLKLIEHTGQAVTNYFFLAIFGLIFLINFIFVDNGLLGPHINFLHSVTVLILAVGLIFGLLLLLRHFKNALILEKPWVFFITYFSLCIAGILIFVHPLVWDIGSTIFSLKLFKVNHMLSTYLINHQNNLPFYSIIFVIDKFYSVNNKFLTPLLDFINAGIISASLALIGSRLRSANKDWGKYFYVFSLIFLPLILYATVPYTDTFCLIFLALFIKLFDLKPVESKKDIWTFLASLFFLSLAALIKQSVTIVVFATTIILFFRFLKAPSFKKIALALLPLMVFLSTLLVFNNVVVTRILGGDKAQLKMQAIPIEHYFYMGQNEKRFGIYNQEDANLTLGLLKEFPNDPAQIKKILWGKTLQRVEGRSLAQNLQYNTYKFSKIWGQPDFFLFLEGGDCNFKGIIKNFRCFNQQQFEIFWYVCDVIFNALLIIILFGSFKSKNKMDDPDLITLSKLSLIGVTIFLMLWETRSRYLLSFTPFMLILASYYFGQVRPRAKKPKA